MDEILYAGIADLRTAEALSAEYLLLLAAREALPSHPALIYAGDARGSGSATLKVPQIGLAGYDLLAPTADGASVANTALTDASVTITPGRQSKAYEASDLARGTGGLIDVTAFALDAVQSHASTLVSLVANVTDGFTATVGTSTVDLSIADFLAAIQALEVANVPAPYLAILHPQQVGDLRAALASAGGGAIQWMDASRAQIERVGTGARGSFAGVDIFSTSHVPTANAGADRAGGMFGRGAVLWADMSIDTEGDPDRLAIGGKILFERARSARTGTTAYVSHAYLGVAIGIDPAGVSIITDA